MFCSYFFTSSLLAQQLTATEIVKKSQQLMRADSNFGIYQMQVITPSWQRTLRLQAWEEGRDKTFIHIIHPAKDKGNNFLKLDYNMWHYIAKIERTIKIPPSMMKDSWMGSDFTNDDLVKESNMVKDYKHEIAAQEKVDGQLTYKIKLLPKPDSPVVWGKLLLWIRKADFIPLRKEYYDESGNLERVLTYTNIKYMDGRKIPTIWKMSPKYKEGHKSILQILKIDFNLKIDSSVFTLQNLKREK